MLISQKVRRDMRLKKVEKYHNWIWPSIWGGDIKTLFNVSGDIINHVIVNRMWHTLWHDLQLLKLVMFHSMVSKNNKDKKIRHKRLFPPIFVSSYLTESPSPGRTPRALVACTRRRRQHSAGTHARPGSPSRHATSGRAGDKDWHMPSRRWNTEGWISCHWRRQSGWKRDPETGTDTTWCALRHAHLAPVDQRSARGWGCETAPTGGGETPYASTIRKWWSAISCGRWQKWRQDEQWRH